jgi:predicted restriction endonuclease
MESRKLFIFSSRMYEAAQNLRKASDRCAFYDAVCTYALEGELPDFSELPSRVTKAFSLVRHDIELGRRSAEEIRRSTEYKQWRSAVFERDNYTCQRCGSRGVKINAHHIKPFATFPELRTDVDNGITLCTACHKAVHHGS